MILLKMILYVKILKYFWKRWKDHLNLLIYRHILMIQLLFINWTIHSNEKLNVIETYYYFLGKIYEREKIGKHITKYANAVELLDMSLVFYHLLLEL